MKENELSPPQTVDHNTPPDKKIWQGGDEGDYGTSYDQLMMSIGEEKKKNIN